MNENLTIDLRNPKIVKKIGLAVLTKELGSAGAAHFIKQYDRGDGDYTAERWERLDSLSYDEVLAGIRSVEKRKTKKII
jgi:hypothetical protein